MSRNYLGLVLAGGRSSRMGQDKALLSFGQETLFEYILRRLSRQISDIIISTHSSHAIFSHCGRAIIRDIDPFAQHGPLSGLYAAFDYCQKSAQDYHGLITVAVDTPFFPDDYVARLCQAVSKTHADRVFIATTKERSHPTFALWPLSIRGGAIGSLSLASALQLHLEENKYSLLSFAHQLQAEPIDFPDEAAFFNINTPQDWVLARNRFAMLRTADGKRTD